ncbi:MAG: phosphatidate cytidylyltransferase [Actinobacteria bacterium]|nr:phosphatidate cytidylyltransferase [Actinomycetota bacterium]
MTKTPPRSAGRNLPVAILVALVLAAAALLSLFFVKALFVALAVVALGFGALELIRGLQPAGARVSRSATVIAIAVVMVAAYVYGPLGLLVAYGFGVLVVATLALTRASEGFIRLAGFSVFVLTYLAFLPAFAMLMLREQDGAQLVFVFLALVVANDVGGYAVGALAGRHSINPVLSPKKTWEGLAGSLVSQMIVGAVTFTWVLDRPWWQGVLVGAVLTASATLGDFFESALKRDIGVKDMGSILPGHGGAMERLDSLIPTAFLAWILFSVTG